MLPRTLAIASLRQTSWLRFQTEVQRRESSGGWKKAAAEFMVAGADERKRAPEESAAHGPRYSTRLTPRAPLRTLRGDVSAREARGNDQCGRRAAGAGSGIV